MTKPLLAITQGDPAGVGPESIVGAWGETSIHDVCRPLVIGHPEIIRRAVRLWKVGVTVQEINSPGEANPSVDVIPCLNVCDDAVLDVEPCVISPIAGQAAYDATVAATKLALAGEVDGIVTSPLHKGAWNLAGVPHPGHTELLAELCEVDDFAMLLYLACDESGEGPQGKAGLAVVHVTLHTAMTNVFDMITTESVLAKIRQLDQFVRRIKNSKKPPVIGVAALNPHCGEGGLFGREEVETIIPAVELAKKEGIDASGPLATDTLMVAAKAGHYDAIVAMYHDQGHIALKLMGMHRAVNITLGLPIVRTSVAHGTAFDIAWKRQVEVGSMLEAISVAAKLVQD